VQEIEKITQLAMRYTGTDPNPLVVYGYGSYIPTGNLYE